MSSDVISICCTINSSYARHFGVMCTSLFENNLASRFQIFLVYDNLKKKDKSRIDQLFLRYKQSIIYLPFHQGGLVEQYPLSNHASPANYYRLFMPEILPIGLEKVLYLDCDLLVLKDINPLWNMDNHSKEYQVWAMPEGTTVEKAKALGIDNPDDYYNSGVMLINLRKWREEQLRDRFLKFIQDNSEKIEFWDQDVLNVICNKYGKISSYWNTKIVDILETNNIGIIHFAGIFKPWHKESKYPLKNLYFQYLHKSPWKPLFSLIH
jgi:lipopolysaccharide biosynthesis glycosyltransferase